MSLHAGCHKSEMLEASGSMHLCTGKAHGGSALRQLQISESLVQRPRPQGVGRVLLLLLLLL